MKSTLLILLLISTVTVLAQNNPIYSIKIDSIVGSSKIDFNDFRGKKILIVNAASTDSNFAMQYRELIQLYKLYRQKLVIVVVPSNSFNSETGSNQQIAAKYEQNSFYKFPVSAKANVINPQIHTLFKWLTRKADNSLLDSEIKKPFYKYLISAEGKLIASFNEKIKPMNEIIQAAINR